MTATLHRDIGETTDPGFTRRRVWHAPEVRSHSLVVLTATRLYLTPPTGEPRRETLAAIQGQPDLDSLLGPSALPIDLVAVRRARLDLLSNTLKVEYDGAARARLATTIQFATAEAADAAFSKLWRRLGERFELTPTRPPFWAAARSPLGVLAGILLATLVLALVVSGYADFAPAAAAPPPLDAALTRADWRVICGFGGAALAVAQVWLYRRLTCPTSRLEIVRR